MKAWLFQRVCQFERRWSLPLSPLTKMSLSTRDYLLLAYSTRSQQPSGGSLGPLLLASPSFSISLIEHSPLLLSHWLAASPSCLLTPSASQKKFLLGVSIGLASSLALPLSLRCLYNRHSTCLDKYQFCRLVAARWFFAYRRTFWC